MSQGTTPTPQGPSAPAAGQAPFQAQANQGWQRPVPAQQYYPGMAMAVPGARLHPVTGQPVSDKSKSTLLLLSFFLGGFGVDRFYKGVIAARDPQAGDSWTPWRLDSDRLHHVHRRESHGQARARAALSSPMEACDDRLSEHQAAVALAEQLVRQQAGEASFGLVTVGPGVQRQLDPDPLGVVAD